MDYIEPRDTHREPNKSYTHIAFTIKSEEFDECLDKLNNLKVHVLPGRTRDERDQKSIYFLDPDRHKFEFHTGNLNDRLEYYKADKEHMIFYDD